MICTFVCTCIIVKGTGIGVSDIFTGPTLTTLPASDVNYHFCEGVLILFLYAFKGENVFFKCSIVVHV